MIELLGDEKLQTFRKRECDNPRPYLDGSTCVGQEAEIMECQRPCPSRLLIEFV